MANLFNLLLLTLVLCCCCCAVLGFKFTRCGGNDDLEVQKIQLAPPVIYLPGSMSVAFAGAINRPFNNMDMQLNLWRQTFLGNIKIPCLFNIGSCSYPDLCNLLDRMIEEDWAGIAASVAKEIRKLISTIDIADGASCPFKPAALDIENRTLELPSIPSILAFIASGKYKFRIELFNRDTKDLLSCFEVELELKKGD